MTDRIEQIGELLIQLQSSDFFEREEAVKNLGDCNQDEAVAGLVTALEDPNLGIRELAADFLIQIKSVIGAQLLIRFLGHEDIGTRNLAAEILMKIGKPAVQPLIDDLVDDDYDIRKFIVDILGIIGDEAAVGPLCERLSDNNLNVAISATEALGEIGSPEAIPALEKAYEQIEDARLQAVEALGKIGDPKILARLYNFLKTDDPMILYAVIEAIGHTGMMASVEYLMPLLDHEDTTISEVALRAIITISEANDGKLDYDLPLDRFIDYLFDSVKRKDERITDFILNRLPRWYGNNVVESVLDVVESLNEEDTDRLVEAFGQAGVSTSGIMLKKFPDVLPKARLVILDVFRKFVDEEIALKLVDYISDESPEVREKIAWVLGVSGSDEVLPALKKLARDEVGHVRRSAFRSLGWLCSEQNVDFLFTGLDDKYPDVREAAVGALIIAGGSKVAAKFTADLYHENTERQRLAVMALGMVGQAEVVEPLQKALNHPEASIRKSAINALAKINKDVDSDVLMISLNDENSGVRKAAISALMVIKGEKAAADIRFLLDDEDIWVRYHAINAIAETGCEQYGEYLHPYLNDEQDVIKIAVTKALAQLGCQEALSDIRKLSQEKNEDIAVVAREAVSSLEGTH